MGGGPGWPQAPARNAPRGTAHLTARAQDPGSSRHHRTNRPHPQPKSQDRAHRLERLRHGVRIDCAAARPPARNHSAPGTPATISRSRAGGSGSPSSADPPRPRTARSASYVRYAGRSRPSRFSSESRRRFTAGGNLFARALAQWTRATLNRWRRPRRFRPASSFRSSRGSRESARSTRSRSRSVLHHSPGGRSSARRSCSRSTLPSAMMDLTTLEGQDTPGKIAALASKAIRPDPSDAGVPSVAAVCVYPNLVPAAVDRVRGLERQGRVGRDGVPVGPVADAREGDRGARSRRDGCRRGRHGDRPRRVPLRAIRQGLRRDRPGQGGVRRRRT